MKMQQSMQGYAMQALMVQALSDVGDKKVLKELL